MVGSSELGVQTDGVLHQVKLLVEEQLDYGHKTILEKTYLIKEMDLFSTDKSNGLTTRAQKFNRKTASMRQENQEKV